MEFKELTLPIEMSINNAEAEYEIWFDLNYEAAWIAPFSGTSYAFCPDIPEEHEIYNVKIECIDGSFRALTDDELEYVTPILEEYAIEIIKEYKASK